MTENSIRSTLAKLELESSHRASIQPPDTSIYPARGHDQALEFERPLVIGNRGMGKSFWAAVLTHAATRSRASELFPRANLAGLQGILGFHEDAGRASGNEQIAPSSAEISVALNKGAQPETIWQAVLLRACAVCSRDGDLIAFAEQVSALRADPLLFEKVLREADGRLMATNRRLLIVFDGLDRLARDWATIRLLSQEVLRLAWDLGGTRAIRAKVFMRSDQARDDRLFAFQDASKLRTRRVSLTWLRSDLYGLLFKKLWDNSSSRLELGRIAQKELGLGAPPAFLPEELTYSDVRQAQVFSAIAGKYMGTDRRRGRTYSWVHQHLADAFEQTSPRSFVLALSEAARMTEPSRPTAVDYQGIKAGVVRASQGRLEELKEDNPWIGETLTDLEGLEVPCPPEVFEKR